MLRITYNQNEKEISLAFSGRMDTMAVANLNETIAAETVMLERKPEDKIVFDLQNVDYIASSFIRICLVYAKQAGEGNFSIANCQPFVKKIFKISGLDEALNIK
ncbi:MAG: STAS domain-containing protein [Bacteroidota bacterium]